MSKDPRTILTVHYPEEELGFALFIPCRFYGRKNSVYCTQVVSSVFALLSACSQSFSLFRLCLLLQSGLECVKNGSSPQSYSKCNFETSFCNVWKCWGTTQKVAVINYMGLAFINLFQETDIIRVDLKINSCLWFATCQNRRSSFTMNHKYFLKP